MPARTKKGNKGNNSSRNRLTSSQRLRLLKRVYKDKVAVSQTCKAFGVSRFTFYKLAKRYIKGASDETNLRLLSDRFRRDKAHYKTVSPQVEKKVLEVIRKRPRLSVHKIAVSVSGISNYGVQLLLKKLDLSTSSKRKEFSRLSWAGVEKILRQNGVGLRGFVDSQEKLNIVRRVVDKRENVSQVCREVGISRFTYYRWLKLYQKISSVSGLKNRWIAGKAHYRAIPERVEKAVLDAVVADPVLSTHKMAAKIAGISNYGVQTIYKRHSLNTFEKRVEYARVREAEVPVVRPATGWLNKLKLVWEQFIPTRAPAGPPILLNKIKTPFLASFFLTLIVSNWFKFIINAPNIRIGLGWMFASIALLAGTIFLIYSIKYYLTIAVVLSFSRKSARRELGLEREDEREGFLTNFFRSARSGREIVDSSEPISDWSVKGLLSSIFGIDVAQIRKGDEVAGGLEAHLDDVELTRHPFISVQLPFYNEKRVAERVIRACQSFDYPNFEILVLDDSTDGTTTICERLAKEDKRVRVLHRPTREGFKGGALAYAQAYQNPKTEFIVVFDADFVPYPDTLQQFLKYFKASNNDSEDYSKSNIAAVQGYQWHVLNKSENWITRGVRSEFAGSYVIERSGEEVYGGLKQISGSVYMLRTKPLNEVGGWGTSITEDFQLTLKLYERGYKVLYTPYIQAPSECVSTFKRLVRQRMRWAEGHSNNIRRMFKRLLVGRWEGSRGEWISSPLSLTEKLEFLYLSPYYLQAFFFMVGTMSWLLSEVVFGAKLPIWTQLWGWSLVLTNMFALPLMNAVGLFLEEAEGRDYLGLGSFIAITYFMVPFQAYAALKGFIQDEEGPWFRTPKTGKITDVFKRGSFYRFIQGILPWGESEGLQLAERLERGWVGNYHLALSTANNRFDSFAIRPQKKRLLGKIGLVFVLVSSLLLHSMAFYAQPVEAAWMDNSWQYRKSHTINSATGSGTNYQVKITVHYGSGSDSGGDVYLNSKSETNFSDIRFTDNDETTELDYWMEEKTDSTSAVFWVEVVDDLSSSNQDIYIYYGNDSTSTTSNGSNTFVFFDDFTGTLSQWSRDSTSGVYPEIPSGQTYVRCGGGTTSSPYGWTSLGSSPTYSSFQDAAIRFRARTATNGIGEVSFRGDYTNDDGYKARFDNRNGQGNSFLKPPYTVGVWNFLSSCTGDSDEPVADTWYAYDITASGTSFNFYRDGSLKRNCSDSEYSAAGEISLQNHYGSYSDYDWVAVRKFVSSEPTHGSWGSEEEVPELVVLLLPIALATPFIVKHLRRKKLAEVRLGN